MANCHRKCMAFSAPIHHAAEGDVIQNLRKMEMKEKIEIDIFCDEIKETSVIGPDGSKEKWIYIGMMLIPLKNKIDIFNQMMVKRCRNENNWHECKKKCDYHDKNGKEIHYQDLRSADVNFIAKEWLRLFMYRTDIYFYMLGINISRLNLKSFGDQRGNDRFNTIYNRFFRSALKKSVKYFFKEYEHVIIRRIMHDNAAIENHEFFPWHSIFKLEKEIDNIHFVKKEIDFIDSDHRISKDRNSHFIQFTDLIMGLVFNNFHFNSKNKRVIEISSELTPVLERIIGSPYNKNSRYKYYRRFDFDFFPKHKLKALDGIENEEKRMNSFYRNRSLVLFEKDQLSLF